MSQKRELLLAQVFDFANEEGADEARIRFELERTAFIQSAGFPTNLFMIKMHNDRFAVRVA